MKVNSQVQYNNRTYTILEINETDGSLNITQSGKDIINCKPEEVKELSISSVESELAQEEETPSNLKRKK